MRNPFKKSPSGQQALDHILARGRHRESLIKLLEAAAQAADWPSLSRIAHQIEVVEAEIEGMVRMLKILEAGVTVPETLKKKGRSK